MHSLFTRRNINAALTAESCRDVMPRVLLDFQGEKAREVRDTSCDVMPRVLLDFQSGTGDLRKVFQNRQESSIKHWDITNVSDFENMFVGYWSHPEFTKRAGTWNNGTFIPTI